MLVCCYCGRNFKNEYDVCPGCGSHTFKKVVSSNNIVIKSPPVNGYNIEIDSYEKSKKLTNIFKWVGLIIVIIMPIFDLPFIISGISLLDEDYSFGIQFILVPLVISLIFIIIGIGFIVVAFKVKKNTNREIERVKKLAQTGILIKNLSYELVPSGTIINGVPVYCIKVLYDNNGTEVPFVSNPKYSGKLGDIDGTADLLVDPNDFSNYYIDFEIY